MDDELETPRTMRKEESLLLPKLSLSPQDEKRLRARNNYQKVSMIRKQVPMHVYDPQVEEQRTLLYRSSMNRHDKDYIVEISESRLKFYIIAYES